MDKLKQAEQNLAQEKEKIMKNISKYWMIWLSPSIKSIIGNHARWSRSISCTVMLQPVIRAVGNIFPVVLYAVAAMVTFTTMTRFVDEERTHAGIFKALGYRSKDIIAKFLLYGLVAGTVGTALGSILGHYLLAGVISSVITKDMVVGETQIQFYWTYSFLALVLSWLASVLPAYLVARRELHDEAASFTA